MSVNSTITNTQNISLINPLNNENSQSTLTQCFNFPNNSYNVLHLNSLSLICKWYSDSTIPRNKVQNLINDIQELNESYKSMFVTKINNCMSISSDPKVKNELTSLLNVVYDFSTPFEKMKTEYLRFQTLTELGLLINPDEIVIGYSLDDKLVNGRVDVKHKAVKTCLISLRKVFKKMLEHSNLFNC